MFYLVLMALLIMTFFGAGITLVMNRHDERTFGGCVMLMATSVAAAIIFTFLAMITLIDTGEVGVIKIFGVTQQGQLEPGLHLTSPVARVSFYSTLRRDFEIKTDTVAKDKNTLTVSVGFAARLNPAAAWKLQSTVGETFFDDIVVNSARTALRDGISGFFWDVAATNERGQVQEAIQQNLERIIHEQLLKSGFSDEEARTAFDVYPVQLRSAMPDEKVRNSVSEKTAAQQDLERQKTLTEIAEQEAQRRKNEGLGVNKLFEQLPKGFTANEISQVLSALATKTRADAMLKAVESNQIKTIVMNGDVAAMPALDAAK